MQNGVFNDFKIFSGNANPKLAKEVAKLLGKKVSEATVKKFSDGEIFVSLGETVRGYDVYIIQPTCGPVNDHLMELCIMVDAMKRSSAARINAVIPYYGYARQDRQAHPREPISARLVADIICCTGVDRVITMDLHASQIQGYFNIPVDHLLGMPILAKHVKEMGLEDIVVVSPDHGSVGRARKFAHYFNAPIAIIDKRRPQPNVCEVCNIIGNIEGKTCIMTDDMIDTAGTICNAAQALIDKGAKEVYACATHAVLSGPAIERIQASPIKKMILLNTIPVPRKKKIDKIEVLSVAPLIADTIDHIFHNEPVTPLIGE